MAHTTTAWDKQHGSRRDSRHKQRVMVGPANHAFEANLVRLASLDQSIYYGGSALRRRIGIHDFRMHLHAAAVRGFLARLRDPLQDGVAPLLVDIANVHLDSHAAGDAVDSAGKHFANAHRPDGVDG